MIVACGVTRDFFAFGNSDLVGFSVSVDFGGVAGVLVCFAFSCVGCLFFSPLSNSLTTLGVCLSSESQNVLFN